MPDISVLYRYLLSVSTAHTSHRNLNEFLRRMPGFYIAVIFGHRFSSEAYVTVVKI
jgi:hypothetical protein